MGVVRFLHMLKHSAFINNSWTVLYSVHKSVIRVTFMILIFGYLLPLIPYGYFMRFCIVILSEVEHPYIYWHPVIMYFIFTDALHTF